MKNSHRIYSADSMIAAIREAGIIPFFKGAVPGYSVQEMTDPACWFTSSDMLGPWDWKIDAVQTGDIAYGKFLGGKAAFATLEFYAHLMNYRRSLAKYREMKTIAQAALAHIRENGSAESPQIREAISAQAASKVKKNTVDAVLQFLEMGTWTVVGDIRRIYRGPALEYSGWQRSSFSTPEAVFGGMDTGNPGGSASRDGSGAENADTPAMPSWARHIEDDFRNPLQVDCTPEESRQLLMDHICGMYPGSRHHIEKLL